MNELPEQNERVSMLHFEFPGPRAMLQEKEFQETWDMALDEEKQSWPEVARNNEMQRTRADNMYNALDNIK